MILIGEYDSPFMRRVAVALDAATVSPSSTDPGRSGPTSTALATINPLRRVPTLVLEGGELLIESSAILDALDDMVGPERAHAAAPLDLSVGGAPCGSARYRPVCADKAVSLFYEGVLRETPSEIWVERCRAQIGDVLTRAGGGAVPLSAVAPMVGR